MSQEQTGQKLNATFEKVLNLASTSPESEKMDGQTTPIQKAEVQPGSSLRNYRIPKKTQPTPENTPERELTPEPRIQPPLVFPVAVNGAVTVPGHIPFTSRRFRWHVGSGKYVFRWNKEGRLTSLTFNDNPPSTSTTKDKPSEAAGSKRKPKREPDNKTQAKKRKNQRRTRARTPSPPRREQPRRDRDQDEGLAKFLQKSLDAWNKRERDTNRRSYLASGLRSGSVANCWSTAGCGIDAFVKGLQWVLDNSPDTAEFRE